MGSDLFKKGRKLLKRIYWEQILPLILSQHIFKQLVQCVNSCTLTDQSDNLIRWIEYMYLESTTITIRRMLEEPPKLNGPKKCKSCGAIVTKFKPEKSISLIILLFNIAENIEKNPLLFSREWYRKQRKSGSVERKFADRDFNIITNSKTVKCLSKYRVMKDIDFIKKVAKPIRRFANKVIAHTEKDRRKIGKIKYPQIDKAIESLTNIFNRYSLLVTGPPDPKSRANLMNYNVLSDLKKIWPDRNTK